MVWGTESIGGSYSKVLTDLGHAGTVYEDALNKSQCDPRIARSSRMQLSQQSIVKVDQNASSSLIISKI